MKKHLLKKALGISLTAAMATTAFSGLGAVMLNANAADEDYGLTDNIQDGTILHCFDWKYTDITAELENIAKAGFTSIQTSPVQPSEGAGAWYWLYQPTSFTVGTNELGTPEELAELCDAAHAYGIKVIVDVVANHLAGNHDNIQEDLQPAEYWHTDGEVTNYNNRYQVTHGKIGMEDINSENEYVQQVVADYIQELENLGVDGIRWDAAKHIGLPSEDCDFWSVVTDNNLYHYGEILTGPTDKGSEDLMKEYTDYMSVTDSSYGSVLLSAFKSGKAPAATGNWNTRGISNDKLVYWGESHDTYSNGEGKDSNGVDQNIVDRAYAVAAAQNDASALYLSRPFATARDSIRIGVKGSTHFMRPEITAVNHFHNAMVGKADAYAVSDNCAVITRENGGAVIVCGSGSGEVSVENVNGYVPAGTYKDEVTGNEFTVTDTTITGTVGESGIAVVYDSDFVSKIYAEPDSDTTFTNTITFTFHAVDMETASYTLTDGDSVLEGGVADGMTLETGEIFNDNSTVTLTLSGKGNNGKDISVTYTYYKLADRQLPTLENGGVVFDNTGTAWNDVNIYVYDESGAETITNGAWPGVKMTNEGDNYFSYELPEQFASCNHIMVIFNNNGNDQIPGAMQTGLTMAYTDQKLYDGIKWVNLSGSDNPTDDPDEPVESTKYGIVGSMTGWGTSPDYPMYETEAGVYVGKTKVLVAGDYQFKVRADGAWDESYGVYEEDYDRTNNSQTNIEVTLEENAVIYVMLDTTGDDDMVWGVSYAVVVGDGEPEWIYTGKPQDEEPYDPDCPPDKPVDMSEVEHDNSNTETPNQPSNSTQPSDTSTQPSQTSTDTTDNNNSSANTNTDTNTNNNTDSNSNSSNGSVNTADNTPFMAVMLTIAGIISAAVVFVTTKKKTDK